MKTHHIAGVAAIAFGLLTLISGGSTLFGLVDMGPSCPLSCGSTSSQASPMSLAAGF